MFFQLPRPPERLSLPEKYGRQKTCRNINQRRRIISAGKKGMKENGQSEADQSGHQAQNAVGR